MKKVITVCFAFIFLASLIFVNSASNQSETFSSCKKECGLNNSAMTKICNADFKQCKSECTTSSCIRECSIEKKECKDENKLLLKQCKDSCAREYKPGCLNNTVKFSDSFTNGCEVCTCGERGRVSCKKDAFCNKNPEISESECISNGGFYNELCNGPYFDIVCNQQKFCLCEGNFNYTCPSEYECLKEFTSPNKRTHTIGGWKTLLGVELGQIGVCVK